MASLVTALEAITSPGYWDLNEQSKLDKGITYALTWYPESECPGIPDCRQQEQGMASEYGLLTCGLFPSGCILLSPRGVGSADT